MIHELEAAIADYRDDLATAEARLKARLRILLNVVEAPIIAAAEAQARIDGYGPSSGGPDEGATAGGVSLPLPAASSIESPARVRSNGTASAVAGRAPAAGAAAPSSTSIEPDGHPAPAATRICAKGCGRVFATAAERRGATVHERYCQGVLTTVGERRAAKESWLCRCGESFTSREARDVHATSHPPEPVMADPIGRNPQRHVSGGVKLA